jgi:lipoprotein-anchoring transpeptidase ErfK/SrfK
LREGGSATKPFRRDAFMVVAAVIVALAVIAAVVVAVWPASTKKAGAVYLSVRFPTSHKTVAKTVAKAPAPAGVLVARAVPTSLPISATPGGKPDQTLANPNNLGAPLVLLVAATRDGWVEGYLPERPNESKGWFPESDVTLVRNTEQIEVNLSERHLELLNGKRVVFQTTVAVGAPSSPTPTGYFYVTEVLQITGTDSAYGPYALGLSGFSNTYYSFEGGPGQIAIHGTNEPWVVGEYASHGCVRLNNSQITTLAGMVQAGTPVWIVA